VLDDIKNFSSDYDHIPSSEYFKMEHWNLVPTSQKTHFVFAEISEILACCEDQILKYVQLGMIFNYMSIVFL
jgi:hypothetical protein